MIFFHYILLKPKQLYSSWLAKICIISLLSFVQLFRVVLLVIPILTEYLSSPKVFSWVAQRYVFGVMFFQPFLSLFFDHCIAPLISTCTLKKDASRTRALFGTEQYSYHVEALSILFDFYWSIRTTIFVMFLPIYVLAVFNVFTPYIAQMFHFTDNPCIYGQI